MSASLTLRDGTAEVTLSRRPAPSPCPSAAQAKEV